MIRTFMLPLSFLLASSASFAYGPAWLNGNWNGLGLQPSVSGDYREFSIDLFGDSKSRTYTVEYTSLGCGASWELVSFTLNKATFNETITHNDKGICSGGQVILTKVGKRFVAYSYFTGTQLNSFSTLTKQ